MVSLEIENELIGDEQLLSNKVGKVFAVHVVHVKNLGHVAEDDPFEGRLKRFLTIEFQLRVFYRLTPGSKEKLTNVWA